MEENQPAGGLVGIMDQLWFQRGVLSSEPASGMSFDGSPFPVFRKYASCPSQTFFSTPLDEDSSSALAPLGDDEFSSEYSTSTTSVQEGDDCIDGDEEKQEETKQKQGSKKTRRGSTGRVLEKSMSCNFAGELELEEIKGFMDLGFIFRKQHLSPWMTSLVPGLKRFESPRKKERTCNLNGKMEEESQVRPYLSEAWTIKRPNSALLNLKVPKLSSDADMKKHLKFWAKTVATEIQQES